MAIDISHIKDESIRRAIYELELQAIGVSGAYWINADGTDQRANIVTMLAANSGKTIRIPSGTYAISAATNNPISVPANTTLEGTGPSTIISVIGATGTRTIFNILNSGITFRNLKIIVTSPAASSTIILFSLGGGKENFLIENVEIDGTVADNGAGGITHNVHVIKPIGTSGNNFTGITVEGGYWHSVGRAYFRESTAAQVAILKFLRFRNTRYESFYRNVIAINSPFAETSDIEITGNRFTDQLGRTLGDSNPILVAIGNSTRIIVANNNFQGAGNGISAEETFTSGTITGNNMTLTDTDAFGIRVLDNNVGGVAVSPKNISISDNRIIGPGKATATDHGITLVNDGTAEPAANGVVIANNVVEGWARGLALSDESQTVLARGNVSRSNVIGIWAPRPFLQAEDNLLYDNTTDLNSTNGGMWGAQKFLASPVVSSTGGKVSLAGWEVTLTGITLAATSVTNTAIAPLGGAMIRGDFSFSFMQADTQYIMLQGEYDYDGATFAAVGTPRKVQATQITMSGINSNSGNVNAPLNNTGAQLTNGRLRAKFRGVHLFN